jgi:hypothetical protein
MSPVSRRRRVQVSGTRSALEALSAAEEATVLDELLAAHPDLREPRKPAPFRS